MKKFQINTKHCLLPAACCLFVFLFFSCKKDKAESTATPRIEFVSISPSSAVEYVTPITISFSYDDLDGDLGQNDPNITNLYITDSRNNVTYNYRISQLSPDGSNIHIKGNLNAVIKNTAITDNSSSQPVAYSLYIKDRAGNTSNTITTSAITITK
ncbi:MAG: hypothetical protein EPN85_08910 [Bacteroidetes bacterium]|nr:MAG: hypothetical protein EPN85_08910 [Bacteroidota bacterium]